MIHALYHHINRQVTLREEDFKKVLNLAEQVLVKKGHRLIDQGVVINHQYFVVSGCLRTFMIDPYGKEHTIQFAIEDWWVSDYISYYKGTPAQLIVECLENCSLLKINRDDLKALFNDLPVIERFFRKQLENAFVAYQMRILSGLHQTAEQRYEQFVQHYPDLEKRVKNYQIASYLGITPESLSRLRKLRISKSK